LAVLSAFSLFQEFAFFADDKKNVRNFRLESDSEERPEGRGSLSGLAGVSWRRNGSETCNSPTAINPLRADHKDPHLSAPPFDPLARQRDEKIPIVVSRNFEPSHVYSMFCSLSSAYQMRIYNSNISQANQKVFQFRLSANKGRRKSFSLCQL
jgi:hypothetical protein